MCDNSLIFEALYIMDYHILTNQNAQRLHTELLWLENFVQARATYSQTNTEVEVDFLLTHYQSLGLQDTHLDKLLRDLEAFTKQTHNGMDIKLMMIAQKVVLLLSIAPHVRPEILDIFFYQNTHNRVFTEFGGITGTNHRGFLPTGETAMYMLAGANLALRFKFEYIFTLNHFFYKKNILRLEKPPVNEPKLSGALCISEEYLQLLTTAEPYQPEFTSDFPATRITTKLSWEDLILNHNTQEEIVEVRAWLRQYKTMMTHKDFGKESAGYKCLFHGEPGTGKTLSVKLLGKEIGLDVYRIDLSKIVSKYIGETEKNLYKIFEMAKHRDWILFFDEGDALFGKRSETKSSNDRYANQETAFLLQKMEEHSGILLLATNIRANLDKAFLRRFQSEVYFGMPDENARLVLWEKAFGVPLRLEEGIDLFEIARKFNFTGANIQNIRQYCAVMAMDRGDMLVTKDDFQDAIRKQLQKDGKTI